MGRGASKSFLAAVQKSNNAAIAANEKKAKRETEHTTSLRKSPAGQKSTKELLLEFFEYQLSKHRFLTLQNGYHLHDFLEDPEQPGVRIYTLELHTMDWKLVGGGVTTAKTVTRGSLRKCLMKASTLGAIKRPKKFGEPT